MSKKHLDILDDLRATLDYEVAGVEMDFTESLEELMARRGVNKSELARRIGTSPAYITKILRGGTNFTLETMIKLVRALEGQLNVRVCAAEDNTRWFHAIRNPEQARTRPPTATRFAEREYRIGPTEVNNDELAATA
jgi:transcriptional regulator with XRE-family HTH domain